MCESSKSVLDKRSVCKGVCSEKYIPKEAAGDELLNHIKKMCGMESLDDMYMK